MAHDTAHPAGARPDTDAHIDLTILSQPRYLCVVRAAVEAAARQLGLTREDADAVVIAVDEAVSNVIRHGYAMADDRPIRVQIGPGEHDGRSGIAVEIHDDCAETRPEDIQPRRPHPFADVCSQLPNPPSDAPPPTEASAPPGGLGVHLIRRAMDHIAFRRREDNRGIRLRMFKCIHADRDKDHTSTGPSAAPTHRAGQS